MGNSNHHYSQKIQNLGWYDINNVPRTNEQIDAYLLEFVRNVVGEEQYQCWRCGINEKKNGDVSAFIRRFLWIEHQCMSIAGDDPFDPQQNPETRRVLVFLVKTDLLRHYGHKQHNRTKAIKWPVVRDLMNAFWQRDKKYKDIDFPTKPLQIQEDTDSNQSYDWSLTEKGSFDWFAPQNVPTANDDKDTYVDTFINENCGIDYYEWEWVYPLAVVFRSVSKYVRFWLYQLHQEVFIQKKIDIFDPIIGGHNRTLLIFLIKTDLIRHYGNKQYNRKMAMSWPPVSEFITAFNNRRVKYNDIGQPSLLYPEFDDLKQGDRVGFREDDGYTELEIKERLDVNRYECLDLFAPLNPQGQAIFSELTRDRYRRSRDKLTLSFCESMH